MGKPSAKVTRVVPLDLILSNDRASLGCRTQNSDFEPAPQAPLGLGRPTLITSISFELESKVVAFRGRVAEVVLPDDVSIASSGDNLIHTIDTLNGHRTSKDEPVELISRWLTSRDSVNDHL